MLGISPYIAFRGNCRGAIEFYRSALDAEVLFTQTVGESPMSDMGAAGNIMHCTIKVGDSTIMMCDDLRPESVAGGGNISLAIGLNDPERAKHVFGKLAEIVVARPGQPQFLVIPEFNIQQLGKKVSLPTGRQSLDCL